MIPGMDRERAQIQHLASTLPPSIQARVLTAVSEYHNGLLRQRPPVESSRIPLLVFHFWKNLVMHYAFPNPSTLVAFPIQIEPPRPQLQQPTTATATAQGGRDASILLVEVIVAGRKFVIPQKLKDWIIKIYSSLPFSEQNLIARAHKYIVSVIERVQASGEISKIDWFSFPIPSHQELSSIPLATPPPPPPPPPQRQANINESSSTDFVPLTAVNKNSNKKKKKADKVKDLKSRREIDDTEEELRKKEIRAKKFNTFATTPAMQSSLSFKEDVLPESGTALPVQYEFGDDDEDVFDKTEHLIVSGTCSVLEKPYFRLTSSPDPFLVRPQNVLMSHMGNLEKLWKTKQKEYKYVLDQIRAIRQDLTVQGIRNVFTVYVYETNARLALENGDLGQFNQCQAQLKELHAIPHLSIDDDARAEFLSYSLIYYVMQNMRLDQQKFFLILLSLPERTRNHRFVQVAMNLRNEIISKNYANYFDLLKKCDPATNACACIGKDYPSCLFYILRIFADNVRIAALETICKGFVTATCDWLRDLLAFSSTQDTVSFLDKNQFRLKSSSVDNATDKSLLDCRLSRNRIA